MQAPISPHRSTLDAPGLRLLHQVIPCVQSARCEGSHQCRRAHRLHRPRACTGQTMRRAVHRRARGNGASAPWTRGKPCTNPRSRRCQKGPPMKRTGRRVSRSETRARGAELLLEIGVEELPYQFIAPALASLRVAAARLFEEARLSSGPIGTYGTPRRLVLVVENLALHQTGVKKEVMGPSRSVGFDPQGRPTKAAIGFATGQGLSVENLQVRQTPKGEYLLAVKEDAGKPAKTVLLELLPQLIGQLSFPKAMKWNEAAVRFARPVRWLLALFDGAVVPIEAAGIKARNQTYGHRVMGKGGPIPVRNYESYREALERAGVMVDPMQRRQVIQDQVNRICIKNGVRLNPDESLLDQAVFATE